MWPLWLSKCTFAFSESCLPCAVLSFNRTLTPNLHTIIAVTNNELNETQTKQSQKHPIKKNGYFQSTNNTFVSWNKMIRHSYHCLKSEICASFHLASLQTLDDELSEFTNLKLFLISLIFLEQCFNWIISRERERIKTAAQSIPTSIVCSCCITVIYDFRIHHHSISAFMVKYQLSRAIFES